MVTEGRDMQYLQAGRDKDNWNNPDPVFNCFAVSETGQEEAAASQQMAIQQDQSPEDAQSAKPVANKDPVGMLPENTNATPKRKYTKVKGSPRSHFTDLDEFLMLCTHGDCVKRKVEWLPWTNLSWDTHAPELLLKRHPAESLRKHWNNTFALYGRRDEYLLKALKWTAGVNFMELARKNSMSSPILMGWMSKANFNIRLQETRLQELNGKPSPWYCSEDMREKQRTIWKEKGMKIPGETGTKISRIIFSPPKI
jgi:hypothetical protein